MKTMLVLLSVVLFSLNSLADAVDILAKTLYYEARGEGEVGIRAVATILHNRAVKSYGKASSDFCSKEAKKKMQFSCWNGKKDLPKGKGDSWLVCQKIAKEIHTGTFKTTHKHTHYYAYKLCSPKWARGVAGLVIGNHKFLTV